jgi:hypothetical protein
MPNILSGARDSFWLLRAHSPFRAVDATLGHRRLRCQPSIAAFEGRYGSTYLIEFMYVPLSISPLIVSTSSL